MCDICKKNGKHKHPSKGKAEAHLRSLTSRNGFNEQMVVYECNYCQKWHVGRKKLDKYTRKRGESHAKA